MCLMKIVRITTDYNLSGKVQYLLSNEESAVIRDINYEADVVFDVAIPVGEADMLVNRITDVTNAKATITQGKTDYVPLTK